MAKHALDARAYPPQCRRHFEAGGHHYQRKPQGTRERYRHDLAFRAAMGKASNNLNLLCDALMVPADALTGYIAWLREKHAAGAPLRQLIAANMDRYRRSQHAVQQVQG